jgi:hypothetical protein
MKYHTQILMEFMPMVFGGPEDGWNMSAREFIKKLWLSVDSKLQ